MPEIFTHDPLVDLDGATLNAPHIISPTGIVVADIVGAEAVANKGIPNGYAPLGSDGKINTSFFPVALGSLSFKGAWNANSNSPAIPAAGAGNTGHYYVVSVTGTTTINGISSWPVGSLIVSNGTVWQKVDPLTVVGAVSGVLSGSGVPSNSIGNDGEFYIAIDTWTLYGPKISGAWGSGVSMLGSNGNTILSGTGAPSSGLGNNGDFYLNLVGLVLYGPKAAGTWPGSGTSLYQLPTVQTINASGGSVVLNMDISRHFIINLQADVTSVTITNWPAAGNLARCVVELRNTSTYTYTHPSIVKWSYDYVPSNTLGNGKTDWFSYVSSDGGSKVAGFILGLNFNYV